MGNNMTTFRQETKYQWVRLHRQGKTLTEIQALTKGVAVGLTSEYANTNQVRDLEKLQGGIERLTRTRLDARKLAYEKFFRPRDTIVPGERRQEALAMWLTARGTNLPKQKTLLDWKRDASLKRKGPPNESRPGSSQNVPIGRTTISGEKKVLANWRKLLRSWNQLSKADRKDLSRSFGKALKGNISKIR